MTTQLSDDKTSWTPATPNRKYIENYTLTKFKSGNLFYSNDKDQSFTARKTVKSYTLECGVTPQFAKYKPKNPPVQATNGNEQP